MVGDAAPGFAGPPPDGQLEQIIGVMLGTSARIGEVLAIRKCDVDVTGAPATIRISGTILPLTPATHPCHSPLPLTPATRPWAHPAPGVDRSI